MFSGSVVFFRHFTLNATVRFSFKCCFCETGVVLAFITHIPNFFFFFFHSNAVSFQYVVIMQLFSDWIL